MTEPPSTPSESGPAPGRKERVAPVGFADARPRKRPSLAARRFGYPVSYTHLTLPTNREV